MRRLNLRVFIQMGRLNKCLNGRLLIQNVAEHTPPELLRHQLQAPSDFLGTTATVMVL